MEEPIGRNFKILMARPKTKNNIGYTHARRVVCVCVFFFFFGGSDTHLELQQNR